MNKNIIIYETNDGTINIDVKVDKDTVWLSLDQISSLFNRYKSTISRHIKNIFEEEELFKQSTVAKFATVQNEGHRTIERVIEYYNLDVIISVGYRVKSIEGTRFRQWSNKVLKEYLLDGVAYNKKILEANGKVLKLITILERTADKLESNDVLKVVKDYARSLQLLDDFDHQRINVPTGRKLVYKLEYEELRFLIDNISYNENSGLFGREKDNSFKSSINTIYSTFDGKDLYETLEEKAANLLYFIVKNHSFIDGNKRIAAIVFLYFLDKNKCLYNSNNEKNISDETLVAITLMIATSNSNEKDIIVDLVVNLFNISN